MGSQVKLCKIEGCNNPSWSGGMCKNHTPKKPMSKGVFQQIRDKGPNVPTFQKNVNEMREFFLDIWSKKPHRCENCDTYLGNEPFSYMFDHILEKSKYPDLKYEEENICILCLDCHGDKTNCKLSDFMKEKIKKVKEIFGK